MKQTVDEVDDKFKEYETKKLISAIETFKLFLNDGYEASVIFINKQNPGTNFLITPLSISEIETGLTAIKDNQDE